MTNIDQIIAEIDELQDIYLQCKSFFPALSDKLIGQKSFPTANYYAFKGYNVLIKTEQPITEEFIEKYARIGKWLNENAIIRLFGILHYHKQVGKKNPLLKDLPGYKDIRFCCWIRNVITKTKLNYEPENEDNTKLREELIAYYGLKPTDFKEGIPTPVSQVVEKIFDGCKIYVKAKYATASHGA
jgi:hypothetical protein